MARSYNLLADLDNAIASYSENGKFKDLSESIRQARAQLIAHGIHDYEPLFQSIRGDASPEVHAAALDGLWYLTQNADRRRALPALWKLFNSTSNLDLRRKSGHIIALMSQGKVSRLKLLPILLSKDADEYIRMNIIDGLSYTDDKEILQRLMEVVLDESDNIPVRSRIIEWFKPCPNDDCLEDYLSLLHNPSPDIRFWTVYALDQSRYDDVMGKAAYHPGVISALDQIAAYDHTLPVYWGWHVDREAFEMLSDIHYLPYRTHHIDEDGDPYEETAPFWLISPAPEYMRFSQHYRRMEETGRYNTLPAPVVETTINVDWLRSAIQTEWPEARFDVIPAPREVYLLDWLIEIDGQTLLGGLHRDGYAIVLKASDDALYTFMLWYRSISSEKQLYVYPWADPGFEFKSNMSRDEMQEAWRQQYDELFGRL